MYSDVTSTTNSSAAVATSQVALPRDACEAVYAQAGSQTHSLVTGSPKVGHRPRAHAGPPSAVDAAGWTKEIAMRSKLATGALAGAIGVTGLVGAALVVPAVSYAATGDSAALEQRVDRIKDALGGLVTDGTLTPAQADKVATTLAETAPPPGRGPGRPGGPGGPGRGARLEALEDLGITRAEVRAAAEAGKTLAQLAEEQGVSSAKVVDALVAAQQERLKAAVADGRLTQAEADEKAAALKTRITESLDDPIRRGPGRHHHGGGTPPSATPSTQDDDA